MYRCKPQHEPQPSGPLALWLLAASTLARLNEPYGVRAPTGRQGSSETGGVKVTPAHRGVHVHLPRTLKRLRDTRRRPLAATGADALMTLRKVTALELYPGGGTGSHEPPRGLGLSEPTTGKSVPPLSALPDQERDFLRL